MKIYQMHNPFNYEFARAGRLGTWFPDPGPGVCPECGRSRQQRIEPLIIEWLPGSDKIGDFTWPGFADEVVITQRVRDILEKSLICCVEFSAVVMKQDKGLSQRLRPVRKVKPRVMLPYQGPALWSLVATSWCRLDLEASNVRHVMSCTTCGKPWHELPELGKRHLVVNASTWKGEDCFRITEVPAVTYCTERLKALIDAYGLTNIALSEDGSIADNERT